MNRITGAAPYILAAALLIGAAHTYAQTPAAGFEVPKAMKIEHEELHADLARLTMTGGRHNSIGD